MKKLIFILILPGALWARGQEFSFTLFFEDSKGNKDNIMIGFDSKGSRDSIIAAFNEVNLINVPLNPELDVRISNKADIIGGNYNYTPFSSKKKIIKYYCPMDHWFNVKPFVNIDIYAKNWPVTISWDQGLFEVNCLEGSIFTPYYPAGWWDSGFTYSDFTRVVLAQNNNLTFTKNFPDTWIDNPNDNNYYNYYYLEGLENPVSIFRLGFGDSGLLSLSANYTSIKNDIFLFPNPASNAINIINYALSNMIQEVIAIDYLGRNTPVELTNDLINISHLNCGIYILRFKLSNGEIISKQIIKTI